GDDTRAESRMSVVPGIFAHGRISDRVRVGLAVLAPFGLYVKWPEGWPGAEQSLKTDLKVLAVGGGGQPHPRAGEAVDRPAGAQHGPGRSRRRRLGVSGQPGGAVPGAAR